MESLQTIKSRLAAIRNISQITKAMEVVSATKMRRSQEVALNSRPYAVTALQVLEAIHRSVPYQSPLLEQRAAKTTLVLVVASDRGLAGSFNAQVFKAAEAMVAHDKASQTPGHTFRYAAVGEKSVRYFTKKKGELVGAFSKFGDFVRLEQVEPLATFVVNGFLDHSWDRVLTVSTHFRTTLRQDTLVRQLLPIDFKKIRETVLEIVPEHGRYSGRYPAVTHHTATDYIIEPSAREAMEFLIPRLVRMQVYHLILEANASEHSARRVAMKNATDNAEELSEGYSRSYNKARQAGITKELIELTSTQNALT